MSNPFSVRDPSISHTKVENALLPKEGDDGSNFVLYVDNVNKRIGINNATPKSEIDCVGYIQLRSTPVQRLILWDSAGDHINADIGGAVDGTDGGVLGFITKEDGGIASEKLRINNIGAIGIGGANYGDAGAVLTSNSSTSPVSWNRPYFMKARVNTDYNINNYSASILMTEDNLGGNNYNFGDFSVDTWTCPQTGIYRVSTSLTCASQSGDELRQLVNNTTLYTNAGVVIRAISEAVSFAGFEDSSEFWEASVPAESIEHINIGEKVKLNLYYVIGAGLGLIIKGRTEASRTYMIIERII
jgi:hypothetical protein